MLSLLLLAGCGPQATGLEGIRAEAARLRDLDLATLAMIGGVVDGDATLEIDTTDGEIVAVPVTLRGGTVGLAMEMTIAIDFGIPAELDLSAAGPPVEANDLLGTYDGHGTGAVVIAGVDGRVLENRAGVVLDRDLFALGFAMFAGAEWLRIAVAPEDDDTGDDDTGDDDPAAGGDTGETGEEGETCSAGG